MSLVRTYSCGGVTIAVWEIAEDTENMLANLSPADVSAVSRFASEERRREWLAVRLLLHSVLGCDASIEYDDKGKPCLVGADGYVSISHTKGYAAIAFSSSFPVGLDMELSNREVGAVARRFMYEEDLAVLPQEKWNEYKLIRWTAAEALFKLVGDLGGSYRENIAVKDFVPGNSGLLDLSIKGLPCSPLDYTAFYIFDNPLLLTLCCDKGSFDALLSEQDVFFVSL